MTIRALSLGSRQSASWTIPFTSRVLPPGVALSGDTLVFTRQQSQGQGAGRVLVYGIYARSLPNGPARTISVARERIGRPIPPSYVDGYVVPQISGNVVVWERSRWEDSMPRTDIMEAALPGGAPRVLAWNSAELPVTNGWKVAWLSTENGDLDLVQRDLPTGTQLVIGHKVQ